MTIINYYPHFGGITIARTNIGLRYYFDWTRLQGRVYNEEFETLRKD